MDTKAEAPCLTLTFASSLLVMVCVKRAVQWVGALRFYHGGGASRKGAA